MPNAGVGRRALCTLRQADRIERFDGMEIFESSWRNTTRLRSQALVVSLRAGSVADPRIQIRFKRCARPGLSPNRGRPCLRLVRNRADAYAHGHTVQDEEQETGPHDVVGSTCHRVASLSDSCRPS